MVVFDHLREISKVGLIALEKKACLGPIEFSATLDTNMQI